MKAFVEVLELRDINLGKKICGVGGLRLFKVYLGVVEGYLG